MVRVQAVERAKHRGSEIAASGCVPRLLTIAPGDVATERRHHYRGGDGPKVVDEKLNHSGVKTPGGVVRHNVRVQPPPKAIGCDALLCGT